MILYVGITLLIIASVGIFIYTNNQTRIEITRKVGKTKNDATFTLVPFVKGVPSGHIRIFRANGLNVYFQELEKDIKRSVPNDYKNDIVGGNDGKRGNKKNSRRSNKA